MPPKPRKRMSIHERIFKETPTDASKRTYGGYIRSTANGGPITDESNKNGRGEKDIEINPRLVLIAIAVVVLIAAAFFIILGS